MARGVGIERAHAVDVEPPAVLVERAGDGCEQAWQELVDRHLPLVGAICAAHGLDVAGEGAEAVNQVVWLRLAELLPRLDDADGLGDWIAATTAALCTDDRWAPARRGDVAAHLPPTPSPTALTNGAGVAAAGDRSHRLDVAFGRLGARCQRLLRMVATTPAPAPGEVGAALDLAAADVAPKCAGCLHRLGRMAGRRPDQVLDDLRAALAAAEPPPPSWRTGARRAFAWFLLDVPYAPLAYRSTRWVGAQQAPPGSGDRSLVHQARYEVGRHGIELAVEVKRDDVVMTGRVMTGPATSGRAGPPGSGAGTTGQAGAVGATKVVVRWPGGERVDGTDETGAFRCYELPHAPLCVQLDGPVTLKTGWLVP